MKKEPKKPRFGRARLEFNTERINVVFSNDPSELVELVNTTYWMAGSTWFFPENERGASYYPGYCTNSPNGDVVVTNDWLLMKEFELSCPSRVMFYNVTFDDKGAHMVTKCPKLDKEVLGPISMLTLAMEQAQRYFNRSN